MFLVEVSWEGYIGATHQDLELRKAALGLSIPHKLGLLALGGYEPDTEAAARVWGVEGHKGDGSEGRRGKGEEEFCLNPGGPMQPGTDDVLLCDYQMTHHRHCNMIRDDQMVYKVRTRSQNSIVIVGAEAGWVTWAGEWYNGTWHSMVDGTRSMALHQLFG